MSNERVFLFSIRWSLPARPPKAVGSLILHAGPDKATAKPFVRSCTSCAVVLHLICCYTVHIYVFLQFSGKNGFPHQEKILSTLPAPSETKKRMPLF